MKTKRTAIANRHAGRASTRWDCQRNPEFETPTIRYSYASMITPNSTYEYDFKTRKSELFKQQEIPSGYDKTQYETTRVWAVARDGVKVPVSIVMKKGTKLDGTAPMLLYAYGSYGFSMTPSFSTARLEPGRPRNDLCHRAYSRRRRARRTVAAGRPDVQKD